jgi:hypothetical protein
MPPLDTASITMALSAKRSGLQNCKAEGWLLTMAFLSSSSRDADKEGGTGGQHPVIKFYFKWEFSNVKEDKRLIFNKPP